MPKNGFTLIEILITIVVLAAIAGLSIPNLKKFSEDQKLADAQVALSSDLRQAQSKAQSSIKCASKPAVSWSVKIIDNKSYQIIGCCKDITDVASTQQPLPSVTLKNVTIDSVSGSMTICDTQVNFAEVIFTQNSISYQCQISSIPTILADKSFIITLKKDNQTKTITIDRGGAIRE